MKIRLVITWILKKTGFEYLFRFVKGVGLLTNFHPSDNFFSLCQRRNAVPFETHKTNISITRFIFNIIFLLL